VFGADQVRLRVEGEDLGDEALLRGAAPNGPDVAITVVLSRLSD
jgi:hypothetical protein